MQNTGLFWLYAVGIVLASGILVFAKGNINLARIKGACRAADPR